MSLLPSVYTPGQISEFLSHIGLSDQKDRRHEGNAERDLQFLTLLHIHTITTIPYENLSIHYSREHTNTIDPLLVFAKFVTANRGRGGYCMEISILLNHILRGLGFRVYTSAVRVRDRVDGVPTGIYQGWYHIVNLVTLADGATYMVDVGFGGDGATAPVRLVENFPQKNLGEQEVRLVKEHISTQSDRRPGTKLWVYQYRNGAEREWNGLYAFSEAEAMEPDFAVVNHYTSCHPRSMHLSTVLVVKFLRREERGEQVVYGKRMLVNGVVKENLGGRTAVVEECRTEGERVRALREWFGVEFTEEERGAIVGWRTELRG